MTTNQYKIIQTKECLLSINEEIEELKDAIKALSTLNKFCMNISMRDKYVLSYELPMYKNIHINIKNALKKEVIKTKKELISQIKASKKQILESKYKTK